MKTWLVRSEEIGEPLGMFPAASEEAAGNILRLNYGNAPAYVQDISHLTTEDKARLLVEILQTAEV